METFKDIYIVVSIIWFSASLLFTGVVFWYAWYSKNDDVPEFPPEEVQVENIELNEKLISLIDFTAKEIQQPFAYDDQNKKWVKA